MYSGSRRSSMEQKSSDKKRSMNIIDFLLSQNGTDKQITRNDDEMKVCTICSPRIINIEQNLQQFVTADKFQQIIEKIWGKLKRIEEETIKNQKQIQSLDEKLDQLMQFEQEAPSPLEKSDLTRIEKSIDKKISKEVLNSVKAIDDNVLKHINLQKELQGKYNVLYEKIQEEQANLHQFEDQIQMINHKYQLTREECSDQINQIAMLVKQNTDFLKSNSNEHHQNSQQIQQVQHDIDQLFKNIQDVLKIDSMVQEHDRNIQTFKTQIKQLRSTVNEISDFIQSI